MSWTRITNIESLPLREGRSVDLGDREIALFNLGDRVAAIDAACPHRGGPPFHALFRSCRPAAAPLGWAR